MQIFAEKFATLITSRECCCGNDVPHKAAWRRGAEIAKTAVSCIGSHYRIRHFVATFLSTCLWLLSPLLLAKPSNVTRVFVYTAATCVYQRRSCYTFHYRRHTQTWCGMIAVIESQCCSKSVNIAANATTAIAYAICSIQIRRADTSQRVFVARKLHSHKSNNNSNTYAVHFVCVALQTIARFLSITNAIFQISIH